MAQDWITTLDHDLGGLHPDAAASITRFLESLRAGFRGSIAPANPVVGQCWCDTSVSPPQMRMWSGSEWRGQQAQPALTAPVEGVTRSAAFDGAGFGDAVRLETISELVSIADSGASTSTIQIPAGARVRAVTTRVTVEPEGASTYSVGVAGATTRFGSGISTAESTTSVGYGDETRYASATAIVITPNTDPSVTAGRIRVVVHYEIITPPTS